MKIRSHLKDIKNYMIEIFIIYIIVSKYPSYSSNKIKYYYLRLFQKNHLKPKILERSTLGIFLNPPPPDTLKILLEHPSSKFPINPAINFKFPAQRNEVIPRRIIGRFPSRKRKKVFCLKGWKQ